MENFSDIENLKYPIGQFDEALMEDQLYIERSIFAIEALPVKLFNTVNKLDEKQLDTPYRPGGWTVRQLVHHIPDSHINAYIRFKWTLTEDSPTIKAYFEDRWATLPDSTAPVSLSLNLLSGLHERWITLMKALTETDWERAFIHPETQKAFSLREMVGRYAWHGEHHLTHIRNLVAREGW